MGIFPNEASAIRLVGPILADLHDEWQANDRRNLSEDSMSLLYPERDSLATAGNWSPRVNSKVHHFAGRIC